MSSFLHPAGDYVGKVMRVWGLAIAAVLMALRASQAQNQVPVPVAQEVFGVRSVTIQGSFSVDYGQLATVCASVSPDAKWSDVSFISQPQKALNINKVHQACNGGNVTLQVTSQSGDLNSGICSPIANIQATVAGAPIRDANQNLVQSVGTITLPDSETSRHNQTYTCAYGGFGKPGGIGEWIITFKSQIHQTAHFQGVLANEEVRDIPIGNIPPCVSLKVQRGSGPIFLDNTRPDNIVLCLGGDSPPTGGCANVSVQRISAGACVVNNRVTQARRMDANGNFRTYRSDPNAFSPPLSPSQQ